jgi:uncharacterized membrane-anchored protein
MGRAGLYDRGSANGIARAAGVGEIVEMVRAFVEDEAADEAETRRRFIWNVNIHSVGGDDEARSAGHGGWL